MQEILWTLRLDIGRYRPTRWSRKCDCFVNRGGGMGSAECKEFFMHCRNRNTQSVKKLLKKSPQLISCIDTDHVTPLIAAAESGASWTMMNILCDSLNINSRDRLGRTALYCGVFKMQRRSLERLLIRGADPNSETYASETPLTAAIVCGRKSIVKILLQYGANINYVCKDLGRPVYYAVSGKRLSILQHLLQHGASTHGNFPRNMTLMEWAIDTGDEAIIRAVRTNEHM